MTGLTQCRDARRQVIRVLRCIEVCSVARHALYRLPYEDIVTMTRDTLLGTVGSEERELGLAVIIQTSGPCRRRMT
jgi:hypothetical protein